MEFGFQKLETDWVSEVLTSVLPNIGTLQHQIRGYICDFENLDHPDISHEIWLVIYQFVFYNFLTDANVIKVNG